MISKYLKLILYKLRIIFRIILSFFLSNLLKIYINFNYKESKNKSNKNKYVFFLYGGIGDHLMLRDLIFSLSHKNDTIIFINKKFSFLQCFFYQSKIIFYENLNWELFKNIRNKEFKNSYFVSWSSSIELILIFFASTCKFYFGFIGNFKKIVCSRLIKNSSYSNRYDLYNKEFLSYLLPDLSILDLEDINLKKNKNLFTKIKVPSNYIFININKTIQWGEVSLPLEEWKILADLIIHNTKFNIVLIGNKNEIKLSQIFTAKINNNNRIYNFTGKTSLDQLSYIIKQSKKIITTDSGMMHLSYLFQKSTNP